MGLRKFLVLVVVASFAASLGYAFGVKKLRLEYQRGMPSVVLSQNPPGGIDGTVDFSKFWIVWQKVASQYVDKSAVDSQKMLDGAIAGMVGSLGDPYTSYFTKEQNKEAKDDLGGLFEGVGIQLGFKDKQLTVIAPLEGTPAKKAGVRSGDYILHIRDTENNIDKDTAGMPLPEAVNLIRGKKGTTVQLTLLRDKEQIKVDLVRDTIMVKTAEVEFLDPSASSGQVAWLKVNRFGDRTQEEWNQAVDEIVAKGSSIKGIVLDLRYNPGGYLDGAIYMASEFLPKGKTVVIQRYGDESRTESKVERPGKLLKMSVVVLVNEGSASAAEILSGALQDNHRAKIAGVKSFGKGSVQQPEDLDDGSGLHVTIARWLTPSGKWIDKNGIVPDVEIKLDENKEINGPADDDQLQGAVKLLE